MCVCVYVCVAHVCGDVMLLNFIMFLHNAYVIVSSLAVSGSS